jgi:type II secretory pathway pseudopilin PulG
MMNSREPPEDRGGARAACGRDGPRRASALVIVMIGATVIAILASAAVPMLSTHGKLRRQEELLFFLYSYKRALELYKKDPANNNAYPQNVAALVHSGDATRRRYLRRVYKDPMTDKDPIGEPAAFFLDRDAAGGIQNIRTTSQESLFETTPYARWYLDEKLELRFLAEVGGEFGQ